MENEENTHEKNDCDLVDIVGVEQSLCDGNRSWNFGILLLFQLSFFTQVNLFSICYLYLFQSCLFTT